MTFYTPSQSFEPPVAGGGRGYVPGRDNAVDEIMRKWQNRFCSFRPVSICVTTFNVNGRTPPNRVDDWLEENGHHADLYVFGLQEMDLSVGTYIIDNTKKMDEWLACMQQSLPSRGRGFSKVHTMRLVGIFVAVFQRDACNVRISHVHSSYVATGISVLNNKLGNKGGTAISMRLNDTLACFVNCHLAAGTNELDRRNQDAREISEMVFPNGLSIYDHEVVFWFGDLNYRINSERAGYSNEIVRDLASGSQFGSLFELDQLIEQQRLGKVLTRFKEPKILPFRPTYKYDVGTSRWDTSEKGRQPAWCDRILWWTRDENVRLDQNTYESISSICLSDHKPVRSTFSLQVKTIDQAKANRIHDEAIREADKLANELLPQIALSDTEVNFGEVMFMQPITKVINVKNTGRTNVDLKFISRFGRPMSAAWLQVSPSHCPLGLDDTMPITLTVTIDKKISWELTNEKLEDILVLSLAEGRHYFITVSATYVPRCFGVTLEKLLSNRQLNAAATDDLIDFGDPQDALVDELLPHNIPREVYRLVSALRLLSSAHLQFSDDIDMQIFPLIRNALESDHPRDLTKLFGVTPFSLYSALLRLIDTLKSPVIPSTFSHSLLQSCMDASKLWMTVSQMPPANAALLEYLVQYLREMIAEKPCGREQLQVWADVLFRTQSSSTQRVLVLEQLCAYQKDVLYGTH